MIKVTFTQSGKILSLRLEGHAGYAEDGKDIVCASASILAYTVAQFVTEAERKGDLVAPAQIHLERGNTLITCVPTEDAYFTLQNAYSFALIGYALLENNYPAHVTLYTDVEA